MQARIDSENDSGAVCADPVLKINDTGTTFQDFRKQIRRPVFVRQFSVYDRVERMCEAFKRVHIWPSFGKCKIRFVFFPQNFVVFIFLSPRRISALISGSRYASRSFLLSTYDLFSVLIAVVPMSSFRQFEFAVGCSRGEPFGAMAALSALADDFRRCFGAEPAVELFRLI